MTEQNLPADTPTPAETTAVQPADTSTRKASRTRMWLSGTALVAAGVVAGGGATYAVSIHSVSATQQQASGMGRQGGPGGGFGPGGQSEGGAQGDGGGTPPSGAPAANAQPSDTQTG